MQLSIEQRLEIIFLHLPKLSIRRIAEELNYSRNIVKTWINRYQETGDVQDEEKRGRKRRLQKGRIWTLLL